MKTNTTTYDFNFLKFWAKHDGATAAKISNLKSLAFPDICSAKIVGNAPNTPISGFQVEGAAATYAKIGQDMLTGKINDETYLYNLVDICLLAGWFKKINRRKFTISVPCGTSAWEITTYNDDELEHRCAVLHFAYNEMT